MEYIIFIISATILYTAFYLLNTMPKYVKEENNQTRKDEPVSIENTTWGAPTADEGEEKQFIGKGVWL
jgi:hypothetical protein